MDTVTLCKKTGLTESADDDMTCLKLYDLHRALLNGGRDHSKHIQTTALNVKVGRFRNKLNGTNKSLKE